MRLVSQPSLLRRPYQTLAIPSSPPACLSYFASNLLSTPLRKTSVSTLCLPLSLYFFAGPSLSCCCDFWFTSQVVSSSMNILHYSFSVVTDQLVQIMSMSRTFSLLTLYFLISGLQTSANAAACYQPDGEEAESSFAPCNSNSSAVSMCCNIQNLDRCTAEGVCVSGSNAYDRDSCTDKTWTSPECIHMCTGESAEASNGIP